MWDLPDHGWKRLAVLVFYAALICGAVWLGWRLLTGILLPFVLAWLLAFALEPLVRRCAGDSERRRRVVGVVFLSVTLLLAGVAIYHALERVWSESGRILKTVADGADTVLARLTDLAGRLGERFPFLGGNGGDAEREHQITQLVQNTLHSTLSYAASRIPQGVANVIAGMPGFFITAAVLVMAAYYVEADYPKINRLIRQNLPARAVGVLDRMRGKLGRGMARYARAYLILMVITFAELCIGFHILGIPYAFTLALFTAFVDLLPVLGVGTVLFPWAAVLLLCGNYYRGFGLLILFGACWVVRQIAEPHIVGASIGQKPLVTLIAMYAGFRLCGVGGMLLFPVFALILQKLWESAARQRAQGGTEQNGNGGSATENNGSACKNGENDV